MDASDAAAPVAIFKRRGAKGKTNIRKRPATPPPAGSDSGSDFSSSEDEAGQRTKRRKRNAGTVTATSKAAAAAERDLSATVFTADRSVPITSVNDATKQSNWHEEDPKNLLGSTRPSQRTGQVQKAGQALDGTYKGLANQTTFIQRNPDAPDRKFGPVKAATNIRTITITDFAGDVCKDYKQTGFCGFGDNCKYLHQREDYMAGWQLDRAWEDVTKGKKNISGTVVASIDKNKGAEGDDDDNDDALLASIPFACVICKESYREPIVTRCGHYFCEPCALKRYRKDPSCAACGAGTNGVFNSAKRLKKLLEKKRERAAKRRQAAIEAGEEVSDEEDEE